MTRPSSSDPSSSRFRARKRANSSGSNSISERSPGISPGKAGLVVIGIGSILGLLSPLGPVPLVSGPFLVSLGTILAAPESTSPGVWLRSWWRVAALSAFVCLIGLGLWILVPQAGVAVVIVGSLGAAFSVAFGYPRT